MVESLAAPVWTKGSLFVFMGAILTSIGSLHSNDGWAPALAKPDPMLPQQNKISKNSENKNGWGTGATLVAAMETATVLALAPSVVALTTPDAAHQDVTNTNHRITEAHTGHSYTANQPAIARWNGAV